MYVIKNLFGILVIEYECDKLCDIGKYLDYSNCKCRKRLVDNLIEECIKSIDEVEIEITHTEKNAVLAHCTFYYFQ